MDQFLDQYGFADTGTTEQTDLTTLEVRADQVNDLDTGFQNLCGTLLLLKAGSFPMDRPLFRFNRGAVIYDLTQYIEDPAQGRVANRHRDRRTGIHSLGAADHTVGRAHCDAAHNIVTQMLCYLCYNLLVCHFYFNGIHQIGQSAVGKFNIKHRTVYRSNCADMLLTHLQNLLLLLLFLSFV